MAEVVFLSQIITDADIEMLCNCSFAGLFHYDREKGAEKIAQLREELAKVEWLVAVQPIKYDFVQAVSDCGLWAEKLVHSADDFCALLPSVR